jgi:hypothetical protein
VTFYNKSAGILTVDCGEHLEQFGEY